jgi:hypothetical protein
MDPLIAATAFVAFFEDCFTFAIFWLLPSKTQDVCKPVMFSHRGSFLQTRRLECRGNTI